MLRKTLIIIALLSMVFLAGCAGKPTVGECVDVTKYGEKHTQRYCTVTGNIQRVPSGWAFDVGGSNCKYYVYEYCNNYPTDCYNGQWVPLTGANTIDGKIVSKSYCN